MAEAALAGIAKAVLQQLTSPALKELKLLWGHKTQLEKLEDTVITIKNVLQDAERRQVGDAAVQGWLARLRIALYDADDLFDMVSHRVLHEKAKTGSKIGKEAIRKRLDDIARDINQFNFIRSYIDQDLPERIQREQTHSYTPSNEVVGREQEREDIVRMLLPESYKNQRGVTVVVVIGIGGLGKTTLAQLVYNDKRVQQGFDLCMWTCINYFSDLTEPLVAIIRSATKSEPKGRDLDQLQSLLRQTIDGKRFLLVLDDVWDEDPLNWRKLKILLEAGKRGSVILVTTRSVKVTRSMDAAEPYYHLQGLSDQSAWLLFKKIAFGEEEEGEEQNSGDLEQLGRQIVKKCANAPLAIATVASLLKHKEKKKWFPLVNDELSKVVPDEYRKIMQVLKISYNGLPFPIKRCFAYCSLFPKDHVSKKDIMVRLWIAQGFVEPCAVSQSLEDVAEDYFFRLVDRCFLQVMHTVVFNGVTKYTCGMHDLVHDLAMEVAGSESILVDQISPNFGKKTIHHVSLVYEPVSSVDQLCSFYHSRRIRTLLFHGRISLETSTLEKLMSSFKALRVVNLSAMGIEKIPASIGELIHLRYLDLSYNSMETLPRSICSLYHLQSLILEECKRLKELPEDLGKLLSLRHLEISGCLKLSRMPPGLAALKSLVTLDRLIVHNPSGGLRHLEFLDNLSGSLQIELPVTGWQHATMDAERSSLSRKHRLNALLFDSKSEIGTEEFLEPDTVMNALQPHPNLEDLRILRFGGEKMSPWIFQLHNLVRLTIESCVRCVQLPPLSHLQSLKSLTLWQLSSLVIVEEGMFCNPDSFFPSLESLSFFDMPNLTGWWLQAPSVLPAFPRVTTVAIHKCPKLTTCMPLFPLVEDLWLHGIQEKLFWQAIGSEATGLTSHGFNKLKSLQISMITGLCSLPEVEIRHLTVLQRLEVCSCEQLAVSCSGLSYLTSLEELEFSDVGELEWVDGDDQKPEMPWGHLPRLRYLDIPVMDGNLLKGFKCLTSLQELNITISEQGLQQVPNDEEVEEEDGIVWKSLQKLRKMELRFSGNNNMGTSHHLPKGVQYLSSLQELTICHCKELYLSWRVLINLDNLQILKFEAVERVIDVSSAMVRRQLSSLQKLIITWSSAEWLLEVPWKSFPSLRSLTLESIHNLHALPEGMKHLAALQKLKICWCVSLVSLPYWMNNLSCIRSLCIFRCSKEVEERCKRQTGQDWPKIQHIPQIKISDLDLDYMFSLYEEAKLLNDYKSPKI